MASGAGKVVINLREGEKYGALVEMGADENERTYYPKRFAVDWNVEKLQVRQRFAYRDESDQNPPKMLTFVTGVARLASDYSVSVIGEPTNTTTTVELSLQPDDSPDLLKENESESKETEFRFSRSYGRAHMGFNRADWEFRTSDQWWLECRIHSTALQPLINAITAGTLRQVVLSVKLTNLFTDEPPYVPFSSHEHLFLRPNKHDNTIDMPEVAHGWLEGLGLGLSAVDIAPPSEPEPDYEQEMGQSVVADPAIHPATLASQAMVGHIETLRRTVKWVGGLIVVALFLLLLK